MIPIRDTIPSKNYPLVNNGVIGICVLIYLVQLAQGENLDRFLYIYGLVPARYTVDQISVYFSFHQQVFSFLSFMFLHGGFLHLFSNMLFIYIFGDNIEDHLGHFKYLLFYLLCGLTSGVSQFLENPHANIPTIGASGAIAGVMGAYFILYPRSKILTLIPIIFIPYFIELPAFLFLGVWFILQLLNATGSPGHMSGIAWWAHIGGFVFGIVFLKLFSLFPETSMSQKMRTLTAKKKSPRLQVIHTFGSGDDPQLYGSIAITGFEAAYGARKLVNIPWGFHERLYNVTIPPGIRDGSLLKLKEMGKVTHEGARGDLLLKVTIQPK